jgi:glucokinase
MSYAIGIDLGGTNIKAAAVAPEGRTLGTASFETLDEGTEWISRVRDVVATVEAGTGSPAGWIGLSAPGLAAPDGSRILWMQGRMDAVQGVDWTEYLNSERKVPVINDAHAALLGEVWQGAAAGFRNVLLLTLGTGVGGGALVDGKLLKGRIGRGGHFGHISLDPDGPLDITGAPGSLETVIGDYTVRERSGGRFDSTQALVAAHRAGDAAATEVWLRSTRGLAAGLVSLINVLDPEAVILGGGIANAGPALFEPLQRHLDRWEWRPTGERVALLPAALGEWAGAYGAAYNVLEAHGAIGAAS